MKVLLDTDVLLDVALFRREFYEASARVLEWAEAEPGQAGVAWHSLSNLAYLVRPDARPFLRELLQFVEVAPVSTESARLALEMSLGDFEDALQVASAIAFGATFLVTRNLAHYKRSPLPAFSPAQFLEHVARG
ncbi:MAG: PIN domain-containing protein [Chloroflexi bacterium]|nr:PIN domain-containing protein [Chloroflexota bacterium]